MHMLEIKSLQKEQFGLQLRFQKTKRMIRWQAVQQLKILLLVIT